jgi:hypothetical protein
MSFETATLPLVACLTLGSVLFVILQPRRLDQELQPLKVEATARAQVGDTSRHRASRRGQTGL